jgi:hypothetical protein
LRDIVIDLFDVNQLLTSAWSGSGKILLSSNSLGNVGVLVLLALLVGFSILRWYIRRNDQDLVI